MVGFFFCLFVCLFVFVFFLTASENFNVGMHSDIDEPIWFKFGMVIDNTRLDISVQST